MTDEEKTKYIAMFKEIRRCREGETLHEYVHRVWREQGVLPLLPIDECGSELWEMRYGKTRNK